MSVLVILSILVSIVLVLALPVGIVTGVVLLVRRSKSGGAVLGPPVVPDRASHFPVAWDRSFLYVLSFAGLISVLFAIWSALGVGVGLILQHVITVGVLVSTSDAKTQIAIDLAALIVGAPLWLGCWRVVQRRVTGSPAEKETLERRLYLGAVFAVTAIVSLFALQSLLKALFGLPGSADQLQAVKDAVRSGLGLLTFGLAWLGYARLGWRERGPRAWDTAHDLAVYAVTGFGLVFLGIGLGGAIQHLVVALQGTPESYSPAEVSNVSWTVWGEVASWLLAGGLIWGAIWRYDLLRGGPRLARIAYLYLVLIAAVPPALIWGGIVSWEFLRRGFGYVDHPNSWGFLVDMLPVLVVSAAIWAYHWMVLRRQAALFDREPTVERAITWPRRPAIAALALSGLAVAVYGCVTLLWLAIDALLVSHSTPGGAWWRDSLSAGLVTGIGGLGIWMSAWLLLQRAAAADPRNERSAPERRRLLSAIALGAALVAGGFAVAMLYQVIRGILQTTDANTLSKGLKYGAAAAIAATLAAYHGMILRRESSVRTRGDTRVRIAALIVTGAEPVLAELRRQTGRRIELLGYLPADTAAPETDLPTLEERLATLQGVERVLLILHPAGGGLYPYSRTAVPATRAESATRPMPAMGTGLAP